MIGGLIEDQVIRLLQEHPGQRYASALTAGERAGLAIEVGFLKPSAASIERMRRSRSAPPWRSYAIARFTGRL